MGRFRHFLSPIAILLIAALLTAACRHVPAPAPESREAGSPSLGTGNRAGDEPASPRYVFGWGEVPAETAAPRGGTSSGAPVTLAPAAVLPLPELTSAATKFDRDRAAILALAGDFRVSFHFLETLGFLPDHEPTRPYHSWATEHVRVIEDSDDFISLQHTLVMFFARNDGSMSEPMVQKHWRQDWSYEATDIHTFRGDRTWARRRLPPDEARGTWTQSVWQVDDSPRYQAVGRWEHTGNRTLWTSETFWRPLPRRESSVRSDYGILEGKHYIVLTPTGWIHEQRNWKRVAGATNDMDAPVFVAQESGLDRYERITAPDLDSADRYWEATAEYWSAVREAWREVLAEQDRFTLRSEVDGRRLFELLFEYAESLVDGAPFDPDPAREHARNTIAQFIFVDAPNS